MSRHGWLFKVATWPGLGWEAPCRDMILGSRHGSAIVVS